MFGFLKRGETSEPVKRPPSFERELFSCRQQQNTPRNPYINISSFSLKWNMSLSIEDVWRYFSISADMPRLLCCHTHSQGCWPKVRDLSVVLTSQVVAHVH